MVFVFWANVLFYLSSRFSSLFNGLESVFVLDLCYVPSLSLSLTLCGLALVSPRIDAKDAKQVCAFIFGFYCSRIFVDMKRILFAQCECERKSTRVSISWTGHISCRAYNTHTHTNMHASIGLVSCIHRNRMRQIWGLNEFIHLSSFSALSSAAICGFPFLLNVVTIHFMMMILPCNATGFNVPSHENNSRENAFFFSGSGLSFFSWSYIYYV